MQLEVYAISEHLCTVRCEPDWTVRQLKEAIEEATSYTVFVGCQQLVLGTTILSDSDVLRDLDGLHGSLTSAELHHQYHDDADDADNEDHEDCLPHEVLTSKMMDEFVPWTAIAGISPDDIAAVLALQAAWMWIGDGISAVAALLMLKDNTLVSVFARVTEADRRCGYADCIVASIETGKTWEELRSKLSPEFVKALTEPITDWPVGSHRIEREDRTSLAFEPKSSLRLAVGQLMQLENCTWTCGEALRKWGIDMQKTSGLEGFWFCPTRALCFRTAAPLEVVPSKNFETLMLYGGADFWEAVEFFQQKIEADVERRMESHLMENHSTKDAQDINLLREVHRRFKVKMQELMLEIDEFVETGQDLDEPIEEWLGRMIKEAEADENGDYHAPEMPATGELILEGRSVPEGGVGLAETVQMWLGAKERIRVEDSEAWPDNRPCAHEDDAENEERQLTSLAPDDDRPHGSNAGTAGAADDQKHRNDRRGRNARKRPETKPKTFSVPLPMPIIILMISAGVVALVALVVSQRRRFANTSNRTIETELMETELPETGIDLRTEDAGDKMMLQRSCSACSQGTFANACFFVLRPRHSGLILKAVKGAGMPIHQDPFNFGNLFLVVTLGFPEAMPEATGTALKQTLGIKETAGESHEDLEEVVCEDIDPLSSAKSSKKVTTQAYDEDDEEHHHGIECKHQ
eukprot:symbB.v1.2.004100.t1/scaffold231.1/size297012/3